MGKASTAAEPLFIYKQTRIKLRGEQLNVGETTKYLGSMSTEMKDPGMYKQHID